MTFFTKPLHDRPHKRATKGMVINMKAFWKLLVAALLLLPFGYEKKENGYSLRAVLYDLDYEEEDGKKNYSVSFLGVLNKQIEVIKKFLGKE